LEGIGPSLVDIVNRPAGSLPDYPYSKALAEANFIWDIGTLRVWIQHSERMRPGTFMRYHNALTEAEIDRLLNLLSLSENILNEPTQ
jgi:cytochrome c2